MFITAVENWLTHTHSREVACYVFFCLEFFFLKCGGATAHLRSEDNVQKPVCSFSQGSRLKLSGLAASAEPSPWPCLSFLNFNLTSPFKPWRMIHRHLYHLYLLFVHLYFFILIILFVIYPLYKMMGFTMIVSYVDCALFITPLSFPVPSPFLWSPSSVHIVL